MNWDRTGQVWQHHDALPFLVYKSEEDEDGHLMHFSVPLREFTAFEQWTFGLPFHVEREWGGQDHWETMPYAYRRLA